MSQACAMVDYRRPWIAANKPEAHARELGLRFETITLEKNSGLPRI